tara:strand:- start:137 stop:1246 length:1110 start_codon:yes stop_codon:yes gene_type:complete
MLKKNPFLYFILLFFFVINKANSENYKIKDLKIKLFDKNKIIKSSRIMTDGFGKVDIKAFAEKANDENVGSIILIVSSKIDKYGPHIRNFFLDYFFKNSNAIFNEDEAYHYIVDENRTTGIQVKEFDLEKFIKRSDDFFEIRSALKGIYKKSSLKNNDRVIKSDHFYLKSNGDLIWISYMFNYETAIKENFFQSGKSKFHPKNINEFPKFKNFMDNWTNLAFKRHDEFQDKLKIKSKIDLVLNGFDNKKNLDFYENLFFSLNISDDQPTNSEKDRKAKEEKERKTKEEKERKAKEEKERKAKEEKERKAKEEKERKAKEENQKKDSTISQDELSVDDLMSKIKELNEMYKSGVISKEEFEMLKNKLLKN